MFINFIFNWLKKSCYYRLKKLNVGSPTNDWNLLEVSSIEQGTELDNLPVPICTTRKYSGSNIKLI